MNGSSQAGRVGERVCGAILIVAIFALLSSAAFGQSPAVAPIISIQLSEAVGDTDRWPGTVFVGQPLTIAIQLRNPAAGEAFAEHLAYLHEERVKAQRAGEARPVERFDPDSFVAVALPKVDLFWSKCFAVIVERRYTDDPNGIGDVVMSRDDFLPMIRVAEQRDRVPAELRDAGTHILLQVPPELTATFDEGQYTVRVIYDTRGFSVEQVESVNAWRGEVIVESAEFEVIAPQSPRQSLALEHLQMNYYLRAQDYSSAIDRAESIVERMPDYDHHRVYLALADARLRMGDKNAAVAALGVYVAAVPHDERIRSHYTQLASTVEAPPIKDG